MGEQTPTVLVHGMWHGSWVWTEVAEELAARGVLSVAVDLEGHGARATSPASFSARPFDPVAFASEPSPVARVMASSAATRLVGQLRRIGRGRPCRVVTHSAAGIVAAIAAEQEPGLVADVVDVAAYLPARGSAATYVGLPENADSRLAPLVTGDPTAIGAVRLDVGDPDRRAELRAAFYHDVARDRADAAIDLLNPDGPLGITAQAATLTAERFGVVPRTYVVCQRDRVVPPALQRVIVADADAVGPMPIEVVELASSHSPMLSMPDRLADVVVAARERAGTGTS